MFKRTEIEEAVSPNMKKIKLEFHMWYCSYFFLYCKFGNEFFVCKINRKRRFFFPMVMIINR